MFLKNKYTWFGWWLVEKVTVLVKSLKKNNFKSSLIAQKYPTISQQYFFIFHLLVCISSSPTLMTSQFCLTPVTSGLQEASVVLDNLLRCTATSCWSKKWFCMVKSPSFTIKTLIDSEFCGTRMDGERMWMSSLYLEPCSCASCSCGGENREGGTGNKGEISIYFLNFKNFYFFCLCFNLFKNQTCSQLIIS